MTIPATPPAHVQPAPVQEDPFAKYGGIRPNAFLKYGGWQLQDPAANRIQFHEKFAPMFRPARYKIAYGGRGGIKSWTFARALLTIGLQKRIRVLCGREFMNTIEDSVYKLLKDQIELMGYGDWYKVTKSRITAPNGTEFRFVGLGDMSSGANRTKLKSFEAFDILWVEEAESVTDRTWEVIIPTIRKRGSEIWITYNPNLPTDSTFQRFHPDGPRYVGTAHPQNVVCIEMNWRDNFWLTDELKFEKDVAFATDPEAAAHIWDGHLRQHSDAVIFKDKYLVHSFDTPALDTKGLRFFHGLDWGFAEDPLFGVRMWITGEMGSGTEELWIDREAYGIHIDNDQIPALLDQTIPTMRTWPVKADSARPETISHVKKFGFNISAAEKWPGSVEDGISHLRSFKMIHIHSRCKHMADEAKLYQYEVDKMTGQVLPKVRDKWNHGWDAVRYALDGYIKRRGAAGMWARLGG